MFTLNSQIESTCPARNETAEPVDLVFFEPRVILKYNSNSSRARKPRTSWWKFLSFLAPLMLVGMFGYFGSFLVANPADPELIKVTGWTLAVLTYATLLVASGFMTLALWDFHDA
jgi:hypothetical protein